MSLTSFFGDSLVYNQRKNNTGYNVYLQVWHQRKILRSPVNLRTGGNSRLAIQWSSGEGHGNIIFVS